MITEFVDGPSLESLLGESNPIEPGRAQTWISAMVEATQAAHEAGLLVGELSPSKVILGNGEELKVMDAGFSGLPADPASVQTELSTLAAIYRRMLGDAAALANPALPKLEASENCAEMLAALKESQVAAPAPTEPADRKPLPKRKSLLKFRKMDRRYVIAIIATLIGIAIGYKVATHGQSEDGYITRWIQSFF
jgi:serine/threonine protein kinase